MPYKDPKKQKEYRKKWHKEHYKGAYREAHIADMKERKDKLRQQFNEYKSKLICSICGENETCCLDFHHTDPSKKSLLFLTLLLFVTVGKIF